MVSLARRFCRGKGRHACREMIEPSHKARMLAAPALPETEIAVAERTGERDLPDIGQGLRRGLKHGRRRFKNSEPAGNLAGLMIEPFLFVMFARAPASFVDGKNRRIKDAVAQGLQPQRREPLSRFARNDLAAAGALVEKIEDDARIVNGGAVLVDQHRNLAEGILSPQ